MFDQSGLSHNIVDVDDLSLTFNIDEVLPQESEYYS